MMPSPSTATGRGADAAAFEGAAGRRVAGVLDRDHRVSAVDERRERGGHERQGLARAGGDHDVVGRARHAARLAQVVGDLVAQRRHAERRRRLRRDLERRRVPPCRPPRAAVDPRRRRPPRQQVDARSGLRLRHRAARGIRRGHRHRSRPPTAVGVGSHELGHAGRRALAHLEVALAGELLVRRDHRAAGDAELGRERPRRGHRVVRPQVSGEDAAPQPLDELHADRLGGVAVDDEERSVHDASRPVNWTAGCCENWTARRTSVLARLAA